MYSLLSHEQLRQTIDTEQLFDAYRISSREYESRFAGSMHWRMHNGVEYLYRVRGNVQKSLGPRSQSTETVIEAFQNGSKSSKETLQQLTKRINQISKINIAMRLGRVPSIASRVLRILREKNLLGNSLFVVGTNAMFVYERLCSVHIDSGMLATGDIDLLFDSRRQLKLASAKIGPEGLMSLLKKVDKSFSLTGHGSFRAFNRDGYFVELICPTPKNRILHTGRNQLISKTESDLSAVEIEGLSWLVNSPKCTQIAIDDRGYPLEIVAPDPRAFALHKLWLSKRSDRDPAKRDRDAAQARLIVELLRNRMPSMAIDDPDALSYLPLEVRNGWTELVSEPRDSSDIGLTPNW